MVVRTVLLAAVAAVLAGCLGDLDGSETRPTIAQQKPTLAPAVAAPGTCPLTLPNGRTAPGHADAGMNHGNGKLWTAMWPYNVVIATPDYIEPDGSVSMKWPWWRGVRGKLTITGRRLDGSAPRLRVYLPDYGRNGFQPSGISFPTAGCWEETGAVGDTELTFVTLVLKASRYRPLANVD